MRSSSTVLRYEIAGFAAVLVLLWVDELLDLPSALFRQPPTPVNLAESSLESLLVLVVAAGVVLLTRRLLSRMRHLEGLLHVCGSCGKVRDEDAWVSMDDYLRRHSDAELQRTFCADCLVREGLGYGPRGSRG